MSKYQNEDDLNEKSKGSYFMPEAMPLGEKDSIGRCAIEASHLSEMFQLDIIELTLELRESPQVVNAISQLAYLTRDLQREMRDGVSKARLKTFEYKRDKIIRSLEGGSYAKL